MSMCEHCHENVAVIYTTTVNNGRSEYKGYCLSCALRQPELKMQRIVRSSGVSEENVDLLTEQLNTVMEPMKDDPPEVLMQKMREIMANIDPKQLMEQMNNFFPQSNESGEGNESEENALPANPEDSDASIEDGAAATDENDVEKPGASSDNLPHKHEAASEKTDTPAKNPMEQLMRSGFAAFGEKSVSEALQMMISGMLGGGDGEHAGLMPVARGSESENEEGAKTKNDERGRGKREGRRQRKFLDTYGSNLTEKAAAGQMDPIIGREKELSRVLQILNRRGKNNPVLLGEPGVGKTAIAEGLALRIAQGKVPAKLLAMEVYLLDMTAMVAGTQFRGQFESRMKGLVDEARNAGNIILVIDELHNIMGAGDAEGAMNAANILKPCLAKGEIRVLGSTTMSEYRRFIEKDTALERRFQQVIVEEPSKDETFAILQGTRRYYETHHHILISDDVLRYAVELADRYVSGRFFPDKAIDIIDEAGSAVNLTDEQLVRHEKLQNELQKVKAEYKEADSNLKTDEDQEAMYERQAKRKAHIMRLEADLTALEETMQPIQLTKQDVASVVELWTGIPLKKISEDESEKLLQLEQRLHERVIGQSKAVNALSRAIRRSRTGLGKRHKPASFIFVGPTGVGKTELVKALAWALFDNADALVRLDMSEYMEAHTVSKLIGSPPGYVGYDDAGQLTEKIRRHPYSVILLDEIEKAHADVFNMLLQILDDGRLTDSHGRTVNFEQCVIIMTSNAGTSNRAAAIGFGNQDTAVRDAQIQDALKNIFRPEFLNRVDEVVRFDALAPEEILQITDLMLKETESALKSRGLALKVTDACKKQLAKEGFSDKYGARPLRKTIQRCMEDPLADMILSGQLKDKIAVAADYQDGEYRFTSL